jgi:hypothetical protein
MMILLLEKGLDAFHGREGLGKAIMDARFVHELYK